MLMPVLIAVASPTRRSSDLICSGYIVLQSLPVIIENCLKSLNIMTENCTCTQIQFTVKTGIFPEVFPFQCNASLQNVGPQTISYERGQVQFIHLTKEVIPGSLTEIGRASCR